MADLGSAAAALLAAHASRAAPTLPLAPPRGDGCSACLSSAAGLPLAFRLLPCRLFAGATGASAAARAASDRASSAAASARRMFKRASKEAPSSASARRMRVASSRCRAIAASRSAATSARSSADTPSSDSRRSSVWIAISGELATELPAELRRVELRRSRSSAARCRACTLTVVPADATRVGGGGACGSAESPTPILLELRVPTTEPLEATRATRAPKGPEERRLMALSGGGGASSSAVGAVATLRTGTGAAATEPRERFAFWLRVRYLCRRSRARVDLMSRERRSSVPGSREG